MRIPTTFDFAALKHVWRSAMPTRSYALYDDGAGVRLVGRINAPRSPRVMRGRDEIRELGDGRIVRQVAVQAWDEL